MKKTILFFVLSIGLASMLLPQTTISQDERMQWWREARFGMFIHWGLYAIPAGEWNGKEVPGIGEGIMGYAKIPVKDYEKLAGQFNPVKFNAHEWVMMAKNAGMKYITFTAKHVDGFAMFKSNASKYNIVDATPYGKDIAKALADECHEQGIKMCFYYQQVGDLHEPDGLGNDWDFPKERNFQKYLDEIVKPQIREILTQYGQVDMIWFDSSGGITKEQAQSLKDIVRSLQPKCIISGRLGGGVETDYISSGDNVIPSLFLNDDWEVPATINNTWGFKKNDHDWKFSGTILKFLFDITAKGGNYLLNVGPTEEGVIPPESVNVLFKVGEWMKVNRESIYGTKANPFKMEFTWGNITHKPGKLYLGFYKWPPDGFFLSGLKNKITKIYLLSDKDQKPLAFKQLYERKFDHHRLKIELPPEAPDKEVSVVVVEIEGEPDVEKEICQQLDGTILLPGLSANVFRKGQPDSLYFINYRAGGAVWKDPEKYITWNFRVEKAGTYKIDIVTTETGHRSVAKWEGGHIVKVMMDKQIREITVANNLETPNFRSPFWKNIHSYGGQLEFRNPGIYKLSLIPVTFPETGAEFSFKEINLTPLNPKR